MYKLPLLSLKTTLDVRNLLTQRFGSLNYKENAIQVGNPVTSDEIKQLEINLSVILSSQSYENLQDLSKAQMTNERFF